MYWELTLSSKGQLTIPKEMREALHLRPGDCVIYSVIDGQIVITPKNVDFNDLAGMLGPAPKGPATLDDIDRSVLAAAGANAADGIDYDEPDVAA